MLLQEEGEEGREGVGGSCGICFWTRRWRGRKTATAAAAVAAAAAAVVPFLHLFLRFRDVLLSRRKASRGRPLMKGVRSARPF